MSGRPDIDVVVVGAGPVGLVTALVLGRRGLRVVVLEACATSNPASRASTVHASTLELLDELGIAWDVIGQGHVIRSMQYRSLKCGPIAEFDFDLIRDYTAFPMRVQSDQRNLTAALRSRVAAVDGVEVRYHAAAEGVRQDDDGAEVTYGGPGGPGSVRARFVVAADGAHSVIRQAVGIDYLGTRYPTRYLSAFTTYDVLAAMPDLAPVTYVSDARDALSVIAQTDHTRVAFHLRGDEPGGSAEVQRRLARFLPATEGDYPVKELLEFSISRRTATAFRAGRVLLAGDAAHLNSPTGGMGMNSGVHDAYLLGKTLSGVVAGEVGEEALDGYAGARRAVAVAYVQQRSERNLKAVLQDGSVDDQAWTARMRAIAADPAASRDYLLKASMFDTAPRVQW